MKECNHDSSCQIHSFNRSPALAVSDDEFLIIKMTSFEIASTHVVFTVHVINHGDVVWREISCKCVIQSKSWHEKWVIFAILICIRNSTYVSWCIMERNMHTYHMSWYLLSKLSIVAHKGNMCKPFIIPLALIMHAHVIHMNQSNCSISTIMHNGSVW